jgi:tryptophan-rich hypothetical protein
MVQRGHRAPPDPGGELRIGRSEMSRVQRRFLLHSRWTALVPLEGNDGERHFEVVAVGRDQVTLRAVLTRRDHRLAIAALADPAAWSLGWRSLRTAP